MDNHVFVDTFRELNDSFLKLIDSLSALRNLSSLMAAGQSDAELLSSALGVLMQYQDLERCSVYLLQDGELVNVAGLSWVEMICLGSDRKSDKQPLYGRFKLGEGLVGRAGETGILQHSRHCAEDHRFEYACCCIEAEKVIIGSLISVPIKTGSEVIGVMNVSHPHVDFFSQAQERLLLIFANFLGQLLINNRLLNSMELKIRERTLQLERALEEAEKLKKRYAELSVIDELTGLHNRRFFFPESSAVLARCLRYKKNFSLLLLDIDHFKSVNDTYGHIVGDEVLVQSSKLFLEQVREADVLARFGGEEFIIALPETDVEGAKQMAERIREAVKAMSFSANERSFGITISIGIASLNEGEKGRSQTVLERLIAEADQALYFGKHSGRDRASAYPEIACFL